MIEFPSTYDRISVETLMKFEANSVLGAPKIDHKSVLGPSWGVPGRPSSARGRPGASPARSGGVPKASLERPLSTKWSNFDDRSPKKMQEPKFRSRFEQAGPRMTRILHRFSSKFDQFSDRSLIKFGNAKIDRNSNDCLQILNTDLKPATC